MRGVLHVLVLLFSFCSVVPSFIGSNFALAADKEIDKAKAQKIICENLLTDAVPLEWVQKMLKDGKASDAQVQRLREIVQRVGFNNAALNLAVVNAHNTKYTFELAQGPMTDQKQSGRCWIFAGLNMVRSQLIAEGKVPADFEFSENYLHFFNMLEKTNNYFEESIAKTFEVENEEPTPNQKPKKLALVASAERMDEIASDFDPHLGDGGFFEYFQFLVLKYGMVPKAAMPETRSAESTGVMSAELKRAMARGTQELLLEAEAVAKEGKQIDITEFQIRMRLVKAKAMRNVWRILATHLGDPPTSFDWRQEGQTRRVGIANVTPVVQRKFTPKEFADSFVEFKPNDYVSVWSHPRIPKDRAYTVPETSIGPTSEEHPIGDLKFLNLSPERMEELTINAIKGGQPVWFAGDVSADVDNKTGIMHPNLFKRDEVYATPKADHMRELSRAAFRFFNLKTGNHAMVLTGFDQPNPNGPVVKFKNENSWGTDVGTKGIFHLYREWFQQNVFQVIIHKKFLSAEELKLFEGKPTVISPNADI